MGAKKSGAQLLRVSRTRWFIEICGFPVKYIFDQMELSTACLGHNLTCLWILSLFIQDSGASVGTSWPRAYISEWAYFSSFELRKFFVQNSYHFVPRGFLVPYHSNIKSLILNLRRLIPVFLILVILKSLANAQSCARIELGPDISFGKSVPDRGDENWPQRGDLSPAVFGLCLVCPTFLVVTWICDLTRWCKCAALGMKGVLIHVAL